MLEMPLELDTSRPHAARMYHYLLGGKNHFAADRETAEKLLVSMPSARTGPRENHAFMAAPAVSPVFSYRGGRYGPAVTGGVQPMLPAAGLPIRLRPGLSRRPSSACAAARPGPPAGH